MNKREYCTAFLYMLLILLSVSGCGSRVANLDSKGNNIICFGDSITYGTGAQKGENYPAYLGKLLKRDVINAGVEGNTTSDALIRLEQDVLEKNPYIVIVELGGNDFLRKVPKKHTLENLEKIVSKIQNYGAIVVLCDISGGFAFPHYRRGYKKLAKKTGSIFIPRALEEVLTKPSLRFDHIHPNSKGYKIIAKIIYEAIRHYIK